MSVTMRLTFDQRRLQHLPTTEREELARQRRGTLGRLLDRRET